jgi:integrase/recombinase XerD
VPAEAEIRRYYQTVWTARRSGDIVLIKTLLYTGVRVAELVAIRLTDADLDACRIRITNGKGGKDRYVRFPASFRETLALHIAAAASTAQYSCSSRHGRSRTPPAASAPCSPATPAKPAWPTTCPPTRLRHFLFTWLKTQGIDDALIQPYSGHASRTSLEIYSRLALPRASARAAALGRGCRPRTPALLGVG